MATYYSDFPTVQFPAIDAEVRDLHNRYIEHLGSQSVEPSHQVGEATDSEREEEPSGAVEGEGRATSPSEAKIDQLAQLQAESDRIREEQNAIGKLRAEMPPPGPKPARAKNVLLGMHLRHWREAGLKFLILTCLAVALVNFGAQHTPVWLIAMASLVFGTIGLVAAQTLTRIEEAWHAARADAATIRLGLGQSVPVIELVVQAWEVLCEQVKGSQLPTEEERRSAYHSAWAQRQGGIVKRGLGVFAMASTILVAMLLLAFRWATTFGSGRNDLAGFALHVIATLAFLIFCAITHPYLLAVPELTHIRRIRKTLEGQWKAQVDNWSENVRIFSGEQDRLKKEHERLENLISSISIDINKLQAGEESENKARENNTKERKNKELQESEQKRRTSWEVTRIRLYTELKRKLEDWEFHRHFTAKEWAQLVQWQGSIDRRSKLLELGNILAILGLTYPASLVLADVFPVFGKIRIAQGNSHLVLSPVAWLVWLVVIRGAEEVIVRFVPQAIMNLQRRNFLHNGYSSDIDRRKAQRFEVVDTKELRSRLVLPSAFTLVGIIIITLEFAANFTYIQNNLVAEGDFLPVVLPVIFTLGFLIVCILKGIDKLDSEWLKLCVGIRRWESATWEEDRLVGQPVSTVSNPIFRRRRLPPGTDPGSPTNQEDQG